jgi:hypothetical protein
MAIRQIGWATRDKTSRAYAGLFLFFLFIGLAAGLPIGRSLVAAKRLAEIRREDPSTLASRPAGGQSSWLIVGVDDLQADRPRLESAWLVLFFPGKPGLALLPLFPGPGGETLEEQFALDPKRYLADGFLEALRSRQLWWTGYVVLDRIGLASILDLLGMPRTAIPNQAGRSESTGSSRQRESATGTVLGQTELLADACQRAGGLFSAAQVARLAAGITPRLRTNLDLAEAARAWPVSDTGKLVVECEFPLQGAAR